MKMKYSVQSEEVKVEIKSLGAELTSIVNSKGEEIMWQGEDPFWPRQSPVLFPFVGRLKGDIYTYQGKSYSLGQHGFARNKEFTLEHQDDSSLTFLLTSDEDSKKIYPFDFELRITYTLLKDTLKVGYEVRNTSQEKMYFSIGAHPAFKCPLDPNSKKEDYQFIFDQKVTAETYLLDTTVGLQSTETAPCLKEDQRLQITPDLFENDALVFKNFPSESVGIAKIGEEPFVEIKFKGFPYLGLWSQMAEAPFVCIEPWHGIAGSINGSQELSEKEGIISLEAREVFEAEYFIKVRSNS